MLDDKDIKKLIEVFSTREEVISKENFENFKEELREEFSKLYSAIDAYAKKVDTYAQEMIMLAHKVDRHEKWLHQVADKLGIKLEY
ncbi:hypothetical protein KJ636_04695 [Patescibacteria group bacterium]|nr:hypothetical protein [Patescibacteria group bacterium]